MDINVISDFISSVGFPIVACAVMFKQNDKMQKTLSDLSATLVSINERLQSVEDAVGGER